jgi:hypothetical protein
MDAVHMQSQGGKERKRQEPQKKTRRRKIK